MCPSLSHLACHTRLSVRSQHSASQEDAERLERHDDAERRTIIVSGTACRGAFARQLRLSFLTLQRRNAVLDAPRPIFAVVLALAEPCS
ncbi:DUF1534 domain-containing protein [Pseudomonas syringae pv. maculicola str. ES4326]|uniref:DUF1534 domain-containing protein n=1 Tax=Pseudomonas syringae pv. maculicola str. ES4326 TaxID=629265 RepID=A0A8T8C2V6_PSEYM|nr:DUF1534 domain-containing protein [Pseudomonas syringae pv. maculicola str. ES4326]